MNYHVESRQKASIKRDHWEVDTALLQHASATSKHHEGFFCFVVRELSMKGLKSPERAAPLAKNRAHGGSGNQGPAKMTEKNCYLLKNPPNTKNILPYKGI